MDKNKNFPSASPPFKRYSVIKEKFPREFLLLQGKGCIWKNCSFCDYYTDSSDNPFEINKPILDKISGKTGVIDIINSGSAMELDDETLSYILKKVKQHNIHIIWFEAHWIYHKKLREFAYKFPGINVKFRIGAETFNKDLLHSWKKGIPENVGPKEIAEYFNGCCLLVGISGQTKENVINDIKTSINYFEYFSINVFNENTTSTKRDPTLIEWFITEVAPKIRDIPKLEILIKNTDLGVG